MCLGTSGLLDKKWCTSPQPHYTLVTGQAVPCHSQPGCRRPSVSCSIDLPDTCMLGCEVADAQHYLVGTNDEVTAACSAVASGCVEASARLAGAPRVNADTVVRTLGTAGGPWSWSLSQNSVDIEIRAEDLLSPVMGDSEASANLIIAPNVLVSGTYTFRLSVAQPTGGVRISEVEITVNNVPSHPHHTPRCLPHPPRDLEAYVKAGMNRAMQTTRASVLDWARLHGKVETAVVIENWARVERVAPPIGSQRK